MLQHSGTPLTAQDDTKNLNARLSASPMSTAFASTNISASEERRYSSIDIVHEESETPQPSGRSRFASVLSVFRSRPNSVSAETPINDNQIQARLQATHSQVQQLSRECDRLRLLLSQAEREGELNEDRLSKIKETNGHCQQLLKRNSDLEQLICEIQNEHDDLIKSLRKETGDKTKEIALIKQQLRIANDKLEALNNIRSKLSATEASKSQSDAQLQALEQQVNKLKHELEVSELDRQSLTSRLESTRDEMSRLKNAQREQWAAIGDTSREMASLVEMNNRLEAEVSSLRDSTRNETDTLRRKMAQETHETQRLKLELDTLIRTNDKNQLEVARLKKEAERSIHFERKAVAAEREANLLSQKLKTSEVVYEREKTELHNHLKRLNEQLKSYDGVHHTAQAALARNVALEKALNDFSKHRQTGQAQAIEVGPLRDALRAAIDAQRSSESQLKIKSKEVDRLEAAVAKLRQQLVNYEAQMTAKISSPSSRDTRDLRAALDGAIESARQQDMDELNRLKTKYEKLLADVRQSHKSELERQAQQFKEESESFRLEREAEVQQKLAAREAELNERFERDLHDLCAAKDAEKEKFKDQLERSMGALQSKREEYWQNRLKETESKAQELSLFYEKKLDEQQRHFESEFQKLRKDFDDLLLQKDFSITSLKADLENAKCRYEEEAIQRKHQIAREAAKLAANDIASACLKFNETLEQSKQQAQDMRRQFEREISELRNQRHSEKDRDGAHVERMIRDLKNEHEQKLTQMRTSLDKLVNAAVAEAAGQIDDLKNKLALAREEIKEVERQRRDTLQELTETQKLSEKRASELEAWKERMEEIMTERASEAKLLGSLQGASGEGRLSAENLQRLIERNRELENLIGDMSEREHNDMKTHLREVVQARETIADLRDQLAVLSMERKPSETMTRLRSEPGTDELVKLKNDRLQLAHELELAKLRIGSLESSLRKDDGQREREEIKARLLKKLQDVDAMIRECINLDQNAEKNSAQLAEAQASRQRLGAEIEYLKGQTRERARKIEDLERSLRETQQHATSFDTAGRDEQERLHRGLEELTMEKSKMSADCKLLEEQLERQSEELTSQISLRDAQLKQLKESNEKMHGLLDRNVDLEKEISSLMTNLRKKVTEPSSSDVPPFQYAERISIQQIDETLTIFEQEFMSRSKKYEKDTQYLSQALRAREAEIERLQQDLCNLRSELESTFASKTESMRVRFEMERNDLVKEKEQFRQNANDLGRELEAMKSELLRLKDFDHKRINDMITSLSEKVTYHQQLVAEIQDERDAEVKRIDAQLRASHAAQAALQKQIEVISKDLLTKDTEISDMTRSVQNVLTEVQSHVSLSGSASELSQLNNLGSTFAELVSKVITSQSASKDMMNTLQGLLNQQGAQIERTEQTRMNMEKIIDQSNQKIHAHFDQLPNIQRSFQDNLNSCKNARSETHIDQSAMVTHQKLLDTMREKAVQRDQQVANLRQQLRDLRIWDIPSLPSLEEPQKLTTQKERAIKIIQKGVNNLESDIDELKQFKRVSESLRSVHVTRRTFRSTIDQTQTQETAIPSEDEENGGLRKRRATESDEDNGSEKRVRIL